MLEIAKSAVKNNRYLYRAARTWMFERRDAVEAEVALLPFIVRRDRLAVDIGANDGLYTHALLKLGVPVVAVEANPSLAKHLGFLFGDRARIVIGAASSTPGTAKLRIPLRTSAGGQNHGLSTIEDRNALDGADILEVEVPRLALDDMDLDPVGFLKIDVEGHELDVLLGARRVLERDRPTILVEAEERHRPRAVASLQELLAPLGYRGYMLRGGGLTSLDNFDVARDQAVPADRVPDLNAGRYEGPYVNNFIFMA